MKKFVMPLVVAAAVFSPHGAQAQDRPLLDGRLVAANYAVTFSQIFLGKVIRGESVPRSFVRSLYEAAPAAGAQYVGMRMVGEDWRLAVPAQIIFQKGVALQRRSIAGEPVFSREMLTSWDLDYLWLNLRVRNGRFLTPRANVVTIAATAFARARFNSEKSFLTGTVFFIPSERVSSNVGGFEALGAIHMRSCEVSCNSLFSHELIHRFQEIRESVLPDVFLRQDRELGWPVSTFRLDASLYLLTYNLQKELNDSGLRSRLFHEWEAGAHSGHRW